MKLKLALLMAVMPYILVAQTSYRPGYYIDNNDKKVTCLIKDLYIQNNPSSFSYKIAKTATAQQLTIKDVKEFGVDSVFKYVRYKVLVDNSSDNLDMLSLSEDPIFKPKTVFLNQLVIGVANLYEYTNGSVKKYFFQTDTLTPKQLIYKKFSRGGGYYENKTYLKQLKDEVNCESIPSANYYNLAYTSAALSDLFIAYNQCKNSTFVSYQRVANNNITTYFTPKLGVRLGRFGYTMNILSANTDGSTRYEKTEDYKNVISYTLGLETEFLLPVNSRHWGLLLEPSVVILRTQQDISNTAVSINYNAIELPIGIRYHFYTRPNKSFFLNAMYQFNFNVGSKAYIGGNNLYSRMVDTDNFVFGLGYKSHKFLADLRYLSNRKLATTYLIDGYQLSYLGIGLGYTL